MWEMIGHVLEHLDERVRAGIAISSPNGDTVGYDANLFVRGESSLQLPLVVAACRLADTGHLDFDLEVAGAPLREIAGKALSDSEVEAIQTLMECIGRDRYNDVISPLGLTATRIDSRGNVWTSPADMTYLVGLIVQREACSASQCEFVLQMLSEQKNRDLLGNVVGHGTLWGSSVGSTDSSVNETGLVSLPSGPLFLSIFLEDVSDITYGNRMLAGLAQAILADVSTMDVTTSPATGCPFQAGMINS